MTNVGNIGPYRDRDLMQGETAPGAEGVRVLSELIPDLLLFFSRGWRHAGLSPLLPVPGKSPIPGRPGWAIPVFPSPPPPWVRPPFPPTFRLETKVFPGTLSVPDRTPRRS